MIFGLIRHFLREKKTKDLIRRIIDLNDIKIKVLDRTGDGDLKEAEVIDLRHNIKILYYLNNKLKVRLPDDTVWPFTIL